MEQRRFIRGEALAVQPCTPDDVVGMIKGMISKATYIAHADLSNLELAVASLHGGRISGAAPSTSAKVEESGEEGVTANEESPVTGATLTDGTEGAAEGEGKAHGKRAGPTEKEKRKREKAKKTGEETPKVKKSRKSRG